MPTAEPRVLVYRTTTCPFCIAAAELLAVHRITSREVSLDGHADRRAFTAAIKPGHRTVPLIVIDGEPIGGYQDLLAFAARGGLDPLADA